MERTEKKIRERKGKGESWEKGERRGEEREGAGECWREGERERRRGGEEGR